LLTTAVAIGLFFYLVKAPIQHQEATPESQPEVNV
jgi:hypothetical protein